MNDAANLGHQAGEKVRGERKKESPTVITEQDTIYDEPPVGKGPDGFPLYYLEDTIIITTWKDQFGKVIGSDTTINKHKR